MIQSLESVFYSDLETVKNQIWEVISIALQAPEEFDRL